MPATMHSFYLRRMYQQNDLVKPGGIELDGEALDLRRHHAAHLRPVHARGPHRALEEHLSGDALFSGPVRFVLAASGHIAGVVNPPDSGQVQLLGQRGAAAPEPEAWFEAATELAGSWWPDWQRWVVAQDRTMVPAREPGEGALPALEDAPGSYVKVMAGD